MVHMLLLDAQRGTARNPPKTPQPPYTSRRMAAAETAHAYPDLRCRLPASPPVLLLTSGLDGPLPRFAALRCSAAAAAASTGALNSSCSSPQSPTPPTPAPSPSLAYSGMGSANSAAGSRLDSPEGPDSPRLVLTARESPRLGPDRPDRGPEAPSALRLAAAAPVMPAAGLAGRLVARAVPLSRLWLMRSPVSFTQSRYTLLLQGAGGRRQGEYRNWCGAVQRSRW